LVTQPLFITPSASSKASEEEVGVYIWSVLRAEIPLRADLTNYKMIYINDFPLNETVVIALGLFIVGVVCYGIYIFFKII